jgi:chemotaxis regulatin CheY-phosphate phosphatase CheZ
LLELLIANPPSTADPDKYAELLSRPALDPGSRSDAANNQDQVDELLESFGF